MARLTYEQVGITEPEEGVIQFEILPEHLKLLRGMQIEWNDIISWGSAQTNPERPYGSRDLVADVRRLLNNDSLTEAEIKKLHQGAAMALQISLKTGKYKAASFRASKYGQDWREFNPKLKRKKDAEGQIPPETGPDGPPDDADREDGPDL